MKNIKPHKIIIEFDDNGEYLRAIAMYRRVDDNGDEEQEYRTINVGTQVIAKQMNTFLNNAKHFIRNKENIRSIKNITNQEI